MILTARSVSTVCKICGIFKAALDNYSNTAVTAVSFQLTDSLYTAQLYTVSCLLVLTNGRTNKPQEEGTVNSVQCRVWK